MQETICVVRLVDHHLRSHPVMRNLGVMMVKTKTIVLTDEMVKLMKKALKVRMGE